MLRKMLIVLLLVVAAGSILTVLLTFLVPQQFTETLIGLLTPVISPDGSVEPKTRELLLLALKKCAFGLIVLAWAALFFAWVTKILKSEVSERPVFLCPEPVGLMEGVAIILILFLALALRLPFLARGFGYDELFTACAYWQNGSWSHIVSDFNLNNQISYNLLAFLSTQVLGLKEWTARLPALIMGLLGVVAVWQGVRRHFSVEAALAAAALLTMSPAHILWSATSRGYSGLVLLSVVAVFLYWDILRRPAANKNILFAMVCIAGFFMHIYYLIFPLAMLVHIAWIQIRANNRSMDVPGLFYAWVTLITTLGGIVILLPALPRNILYMASRSGSSGQVSFFPWMEMFRELLSLPSWAGVVLMGILAVAGYLAMGRDSLQRGLIPLAVLLTGFFTSFSPSWLWLPRFWAGILPLVLIFAAVGIVRFWKARWPAYKILGVVVFAVIVVLPVNEWLEGRSKIPAENFSYFREAVARAESISSANTVFCAFGESRSFYQFYARRPVHVLKGEDDLKDFLNQQAEVLCFTIPSMIDKDRPEDITVLKKIRQFMFNEQWVGPIILLTGRPGRSSGDH